MISYAGREGPVSHRSSPPPLWRGLIAGLAEVPPAQLDEALNEIDDKAASLHPLERQSPFAWAYQYRGEPDPRFRVVRYLRFGHKTTSTLFANLLADPNLRSVTALEAHACHIGSTAARALRSSRIEQLKLLSLIEIRLKADGLARLVGWPALSALQVLDLQGNDELGSVGIVKLAEAPWIMGLEHLDLCGCADKVARSAIEALAAAPFRRLRSFALSGGELVSPKGRGRPLLQARGLARLESLNLSSMGLGDLDLGLLAQSPMLPTLQELQLSHNDFSSAALASLLRAPGLKNLRSLRIAGNLSGPLLDEGVAGALLEAPFLDKLRTLSIGNARGTARLAESDRIAPELRPWLR
jgi:hypothetical protein